MNGIDNINTSALISSNSALLKQSLQIKNNKDDIKTQKTKKFKDLLKNQLFSLNETAVSAELENLNKEEVIAVLQDKVYSAGDELAEQVSPETISAYKKAVKNFMNYAVNQAYDVKNIITGGLNPMKQKAWSLVKVIDSKLDKLAGELIYNQLNKIEILARIDEIKGLLIDLTS